MLINEERALKEFIKIKIAHTKIILHTLKLQFLKVKTLLAYSMLY